MQPQATASTSPFAPSATPAAPTYKPLNLKAYDDTINADANQSAASIQGAISKFEASRRNPLDIYNEAVGQLGVGDVRTRVQNLRNQLLNTENLLNGVDGSVTGRTQGSLVTEAQRQRLVNLEREPIMKDYGKLSGSMSDENATLADLLRQAESQTGLAVQGQSARQQALQFALEQASSREKAAEDTRRWQQEYALKQRELDASIANMRAKAAGLRIPQVAPAPAPAKGPSQSQINAALWLAQNGGAGSARNYVSPNWKDTMAQQNPLLKAGNTIINTAQGVGNVLGAPGRWLAGLLK